MYALHDIMCSKSIARVFVIVLCLLVSLTAALAQNVALGKAVSASAASQNGALSIATDGITDTNPFISLPVGQQWIEIDLQGSYNLTQIKFFHYWGDNRIYHDVVARVSADGVSYTTVYNNDADGSAGFGAGSDAEYAETYAGKTVTLATPICARYVRLYSNGSSLNGYNHYVEIQAFGSACSPPDESNVALNKPVSSSTPSRSAALSIATDGVTDTNPFISLDVGQQWIEVDLQGVYEISQLQFFHYWGDHRTYHDVVAQLSADHSVYTTVFNNDTDGSAGFGVGGDAEYAESYLGKTVTLPAPVCARYVRLYSNGSTLNGYNHYVEIVAMGAASSACSSPPLRDATLWPFASDSPWNMPIGSGAQFETATDLCTNDIAGSGISAWINAATYSHPVYRAHATDPWVGIYNVSNGALLATIQVPTDATPSAPQNGDAHLHVIDAVGRYVHEMWQASRRTDGGFNVRYYVRNDLYGSGIGSGGTRAYGGSAIGGLIRAGELANGIPHVLAFAIPQSRQKPVPGSPVWPATSVDNPNSYAGHVPMGALVAIPGNVDLNAISPPLSAQGMAIAKALQDFGGYDVDSAGSLDFILYLQANAQAELTSAAIDDLRRLRPLLRCVKNNSQSSVGGGGMPRVPLAPPLGTPP